MSPLSPDDAGVVEAVRFPSGPHTLDGRLAYPDAADPAGGVVIAGPHPLLGGDMTNNVVAGLCAGLVGRGVAALAFDYRRPDPAEVARRTAQFWATSHVPDEPAYRDDLAAAVAFLRAAVGPGLPLAGVGYSFGCSLLPHAGLPVGAPLVLVAPTVGTHEYADFATVPNPLLVIAPDGDFAADPAELRAWFAGLRSPKRLIAGRWDDHFFRGHEDWLAGVVADFLTGHWEGGA